MIDKLILDKAIEKAIKNGWSRVITYNAYRTEVSLNRRMYYVLIFSHDFAKAFWGDEPYYVPHLIDRRYPEKTGCIPRYLYELMEMARQLEPLKYLEKFL